MGTRKIQRTKKKNLTESTKEKLKDRERRLKEWRKWWS